MQQFGGANKLKQKRVTFDDIAKHTNFSKTTISRYFNDPDSLTLENQEKIAKALVELNYHENKLAKVLANGNTETTYSNGTKITVNYTDKTVTKGSTTYSLYDYIGKEVIG